MTDTLTDIIVLWSELRVEIGLVALALRNTSTASWDSVPLAKYVIPDSLNLSGTVSPLLRAVSEEWRVLTPYSPVANQPIYGIWSGPGAEKRGGLENLAM